MLVGFVVELEPVRSFYLALFVSFYTEALLASHVFNATALFDSKQQQYVIDNCPLYIAHREIEPYCHANLFQWFETIRMEIHSKHNSTIYAKTEVKMFFLCGQRTSDMWSLYTIQR